MSEVITETILPGTYIEVRAAGLSRSVRSRPATSGSSGLPRRVELILRSYPAMLTERVSSEIQAIGIPMIRMAIFRLSGP